MHWGYSIFAALIVIVLIYALIPDFFLHYMGLGSWRRQYTPGVTLTFDDGPDPVITPQILDILDRYKVKATFFVVGQRAALYPDIIKLIHNRGHFIGAHSQSHRFAWFLFPHETWREMDTCITIVEQLIGEEIKWARPPWGTFNLFTWLWFKIRCKQAVLWDVEGHDWQVQRTPEEIIQRILKHTHAGSIVLLHDAGGDKGAPVNTLNAIDSLCRRITIDLKLPLVPLELPEWSGWHKLIMNIWTNWEQFFAKLYKIEHISSTNVFRLSRKRFKGPNLYSLSGELLAKKGDLVGEIHFDNSRLQYEGSIPGKKGIHILNQVRSSLPALARYISDTPQYQSVSVFVGSTLINQGAKHLGFQVQEMSPNVFIRLVGFYQKLIMMVYNSPPKKKRIGKYTNSNPKLVWISRQQLLENWLP